ncbi:HNH endonuclease [Streptomyces sannanensis]|uniref:HNH endonuclease n=1 Tax=Streptomyces sannanensis TaxID=285536 RepID=A0ABP6SEW4_9ACTN
MDWTERIRGLRQWSQHGERAPHKPLLMLYALGRFQQDADAGLRYSEVEQDLKELLEEYGPRRRTTPAYPFHHLANDEVWEVRTDSGDASPGTGARALRESGAVGRLAPELRAALRADPALGGRLARLLLDLHFAPSLHEDLAEATGVAGVASGAYVPGMRQLRRGAAEMRRRVFEAYEGRCAFCGFDGAMGRRPVGLEAAHVRWWAFQGPDTVTNGLCLCSLHHKLFDKGVLGLDPGRTIVVSQRFAGRGEAARAQVLDLAGRVLTGPRTGSAAVADEHIAWHTAQVFA